MTTVTKEEIEGVASRAHVALSEEELAFYTRSIQNTVNEVAILNEVDTTTVEPMMHVNQNSNKMREDVVANVLDREEMLATTIDHKAGEIKVPAIL